VPASALDGHTNVLLTPASAHALPHDLWRHTHQQSLETPAPNTVRSVPDTTHAPGNSGQKLWDQRQSIESVHRGALLPRPPLEPPETREASSGTRALTTPPGDSASSGEGRSMPAPNIPAAPET
jgi:hypothetical protein